MIVESYGQFMSVFSKTVAERTKPGQRQDVEEKCNSCFFLKLANFFTQIVVV